MKLALGTAQFGLDYGISNHGGRVTLPVAGAIIEYARSHGIDTIDTAMGYGESEQILGALNVRDMRVITKLPNLPAGTQNVTEWVHHQIDGSLERLSLERLDSVLLHRPLQLLDTQGLELAAALRHLKATGKVEKIGVSVYDPDCLAAIMDICPVDIVQAPLNLIDSRLVKSGWLATLNKSGVEVHVRSLFLQGLLLMTPENRPAQFFKWSPIWRVWDNWLDQQGDIDPVTACLAFARQFEEIDRLVIGIDSVTQLAEVVAAMSQCVSVELPDIVCEDAELINPGLWSIK
jgi:aryl-alcohol dehydrogenase-like predicted oxidoreductase